VEGDAVLQPQVTFRAPGLAAVELSILFIAVDFVTSEPAVGLEADAESCVGGFQLRTSIFFRRSANVDRLDMFSVSSVGRNVVVTTAMKVDCGSRNPKVKNRSTGVDGCRERQDWFSSSSHQSFRR
jgi:hypothetical protein